MCHAGTGIPASVASLNAESQGAVQLEDFSNIFANSLKSQVMFNILKTLVNPCLNAPRPLSVTLVINTCLSRETIPAALNHAAVQPLMKEKNLLPSNFTPISKLPDCFIILYLKRDLFYFRILCFVNAFSVILFFILLYSTLVQLQLF